MSAHTPGPWDVVREPLVETDNAGFAALTFVQQIGPFGIEWHDDLNKNNPERIEADITLVAAAPELLDALRAWEHAFKGKTIEAHGLADTMNVGYAIEKTRAAIAKAEGKS